MKNSAILYSTLFLLFFAYSNVCADTRISKVFKCSGEKIEYGDTTYTVLKKCGEPSFKELLSTEGNEQEEKWHYDCYGRGYVEELIFKKGVLVKRMRGEDSQGAQKCTN
jgi:hypothetical protein